MAIFIKMQNLTVYFEFFGNKMKTIVNANTYEQAVKIVKNRIKVVKIEDANNDVVMPTNDDQILNFFKGFK